MQSGKLAVIYKQTNYDTEAKLRFPKTCENTTKKQLSQVKSEKVEIGLEWAKTREQKYRIRMSKTSKLVSKSIGWAKLATNKTATYAHKLPIRCIESSIK